MLARHWLFRFSIAANLCVLVYLALYSTSSNFPSTASPAYEVSSSSISVPSIGANELPPPPPPPQQPSIAHSDPLQSPINKYIVDNELLQKSSNNKGGGGGELESSIQGGGEDQQLGRVENIETANTNNANEETNDGELLPLQLPIIQKPKKNFPCDEMNGRSYYGQRGPFWVLYNYMTATRQFKCDESVTYTTHATYPFLNNLVPLLERWNAPVSLSLYTPGTDFGETLKRVVYLRECTSPLVKELVNFHIYFDHKHIPKKIPSRPMSMTINCSRPEPAFGEDMITYKTTKKLPYPVNVARNVAREMSSTHYVLASDIELYPNPDLAKDFVEMIRRNDSEIRRPNPKVFVLSIFEVEANVTAMPQDKRELVQMLEENIAIPFHKYICEGCHRIPKAKEWISAKYKPGLRIFHIGKRRKPFHHWEPIYIGTRNEPMYDERLTWEGRSDKMTQGYVLCVLDYEFQILDNGFLVHRPGIKRTKTIPSKNPVVSRQNTVIAKTILPELKLLYGMKAGCYV